MPFKHGITLTEISTGARTLTAVSTAILGLVATAPDADADTFPLDRPVLVTDIETAIGKAGLAGTLARSRCAIADQTCPVLVVVRVAEGADDAATASNVIGTTTAEGTKTGMQALLAAQAQLGVKPKILARPAGDAGGHRRARGDRQEAARVCLCPRAGRDDHRSDRLSRQFQRAS
jgi:phage tail sheath protein FI